MDEFDVMYIETEFKSWMVIECGIKRWRPGMKKRCSFQHHFGWVPVSEISELMIMLRRTIYRILITWHGRPSHGRPSTLPMAGPKCTSNLHQARAVLLLRRAEAQNKVVCRSHITLPLISGWGSFIWYPTYRLFLDDSRSEELRCFLIKALNFPLLPFSDATE